MTAFTLVWLIFGGMAYIALGAVVSVSYRPFFLWLLHSKSAFALPPFELFVWPFLLLAFFGSVVLAWLNPPRDPEEIPAATRRREHSHWGSE